MAYPLETEPLSAADTHRYFPDWASLPAAPARLEEADRNSYLAGGYAEEFGHRAPPWWRPYAASPEALPEWRVQMDGLHPGYPDCPRPVDRDSLAAHPAAAAPVRDRAARPAEATHAGASAFKVIRVGERLRAEPGHPAAAGRLALRWREFRVRRRQLASLF